MVQCRGDLDFVYRANLGLRTALRVLRPLHYGTARHEKGLYRLVQEVDWRPYLRLRQTFAIDATVNSRFFNHDKYVALKTKDAIADQFRAHFGQRPSVDVDNPDLRLHVHVQEDQVTISLDSSGDSLHKRGYRQRKVSAPLNEVLAAGLIALSGWPADRTFIDPMCGSGTLLIEAALMARNIPPQWQWKKFGFMQWPEYNAGRWSTVRKDMLARRHDPGFPILGYDRDRRAVQIARENRDHAQLDQWVNIEQRAFEDLQPDVPPGWIIMNPPYDERMPEQDIEAFYQHIGDQLKQHFAGYQAWIFSGHQTALKQVGLRTSRKLHLYNGAIPCKFHGFKLYQGSKKAKKQSNG